MVYPVNISSLHFQYKTVFDALKMYLPDKTDDELSSMVLDFKTKKEEAKQPKEPKEVKEPKEQKEPKEVKETKEPKEVKEPKEPKEVKEPKEPKEVKEPKVVKSKKSKV